MITRRAFLHTKCNGVRLTTVNVYNETWGHAFLSTRYDAIKQQQNRR